LSIFDFNNPPPNHRFTVKVERDETEGERFVRLAKDLVVFSLAAGFVVVIACLCVSTVLNSASGLEEKKWAMSILSAATGGMVGYLVARHQ